MADEETFGGEGAIEFRKQLKEKREARKAERAAERDAGGRPLKIGVDSIQAREDRDAARESESAARNEKFDDAREARREGEHQGPQGNINPRSFSAPGKKSLTEMRDDLLAARAKEAAQRKEPEEPKAPEVPAAEVAARQAAEADADAAAGAVPDAVELEQAAEDAAENAVPPPPTEESLPPTEEPPTPTAEPEPTPPAVSPEEPDPNKGLHRMVSALANRVMILETMVTDDLGDGHDDNPLEDDEQTFEIDYKGTCGTARHSTSIGGGTAVGTWDLQAIEAETDDAIIDVDLANNKIIIKEGHSGLYLISVQCESEININAGSGAGFGNVATIVYQDAGIIFEWTHGVALPEQTPTGSTAPTNHSGTHHQQNSSASRIMFIDASADDVDIQAKHDISSGGDGGTMVHRLKEFSVTLLKLTEDATP